MIRPPFESVDQVTQNEPASLSYPRDTRETPKDKRDIPGTRGKEHHAPPIKRQCAPQTALAGLEPACGVGIARRAPVAAAPPGPGQHQLHTAGRRPDELPKQMTHFRHGERKQWSAIRGRIKGRRGKCAGCGGDSCLFLSTDPRQESMRQHDERDVAIPADPASDLVVIQAHILGRFKIFVG